VTAESFWEPDDSRLPPATAADISAWEAEYGVRLPAVLARALLTQNGGLVRGSALVVEPLQAFASLDEEQWDGVWSDGPLAEADRSSHACCCCTTAWAASCETTASARWRSCSGSHGATAGECAPNETLLQTGAAVWVSLAQRG
jgi:cell wall assembly regulator SMI1